MNRLNLLCRLAPLALCGLIHGQSTNSPSASVVVNFNDAGSFPLSSYMGRIDPNVISIDGQSGALYFISFGAGQAGTTIPGLGILHIDFSLPAVTKMGLLNANGEHMLSFAPGALTGVPAGVQLTTQAAVADDSMSSGFRLSGATDITFVDTMSAPSALAPAAGTTAQARGPLLAINSSSVTIGGIVFNVSSTTVFSNFAALSDLALGDWIVVTGFVGAAGVFDAEEVSLEDPETEARISGLVQSVGPAGLSLLNVSVYVSSSTTFDDGGTPVSFAQVVPGITVEVRIPVDVAPFPHVTSTQLNVNVEPEPEPEPETETEIEFTPPPFCS